MDPETANGMVSAIDYLRIDTSQRDIATKSNGRVIGLWGSDSRHMGSQQEYRGDRQKDVRALHTRPPYEPALQNLSRGQSSFACDAAGESGVVNSLQ